jgi:hypothetical protein
MMDRRPESGKLICLKRPPWWAVVRRDQDGWHAVWLNHRKVSRTAAGNTSGISEDGIGEAWHVLGEDGCPEVTVDVLLAAELSDLEKLNILNTLSKLKRK